METQLRKRQHIQTDFFFFKQFKPKDCPQAQRTRDSPSQYASWAYKLPLI